MPTTGDFYRTRRNTGLSARRNSGDFHRLPSSDTPDIPFPNTSQSGESDVMSSSSRNFNFPKGNLRRLIQRHEPRRNPLPPIELDVLQNIPRSDFPFTNLQNAPDTIESSCNNTQEPFASTSQFEDAFQVYNPTTSVTELAEEADDVLPLADVRLKFREIISGDNDDGGEDNMPKTYSQSKRRRRTCICNCCWFCLKCGSRTRKAYHAFICMMFTIAFCIGAFIVLFLRVDKKDSAAMINLSDYGVLSSHGWPLRDIESQDSNVTDNLREQQRQLWNFEMLEDDNETETTTETNQPGKTSLEYVQSKVTKRHYPGLFTLNGHFIDVAIAEDVFDSAKEFLEKRVHENSSHLEILAWKGEAMDLALDDLSKRLNVSRDSDALDGLFEDYLCDKQPDEDCNRTSWFRSINGSCNNVAHGNWGAQYAPFRRIVDPFSWRNKFPLARLNTEILTGKTPEVDTELSAILPLWGMFILHDTLKVAELPGICKNTNNSHPNIIEDKITAKCPAIYPSCKIGPRTSFNLVTSYIDASNIYGSSEERTAKLRSKSLGKMKVKRVKHMQRKDFLPLARELNETCYGGTGNNCFLSGDDDVNQLSALTALNTLFVRQHNRIASWLHKANPHWNDERIFQESRKIVIAQIQHITYNEFLPQVLGKEVLNISGLLPNKSGFYEDYNVEIDPSASEVYAGAVGYFWYSMAVGKVKTVWKTGKRSGIRRHDLSSLIYRPEFLMKGKGHLEAIVRGFASLGVNRVGLAFPSQLRSLNVKPLNLTLDLVKVVLEKGRALEIAPYLEWRKVCGFSEIKNFQDIKSHWSEDSYKIVTSLYKNVEDVDLITGLLAETKIPTGRVGPTLACLLTDQFLRFKKGDRYWYEGNLYFHHFTELQLASIRQTTLARIICDNTDNNFDQIQTWPMLLKSSQSNPLLQCSDYETIPNLNFRLWKEHPDKKSKLYGSTSDSEDDYQSGDWVFESGEMEKSQEESEEINSIQRILESQNEIGTNSGESTTTKSTNIGESTTTKSIITGEYTTTRKNVSIGESTTEVSRTTVKPVTKDKEKENNNFHNEVLQNKNITSRNAQSLKKAANSNILIPIH